MINGMMGAGIASAASAFIYGYVCLLTANHIEVNPKTATKNGYMSYQEFYALKETRKKRTINYNRVPISVLSRINEHKGGHEIASLNKNGLSIDFNDDFNSQTSHFSETVVNPATGLLMIGGIGGIDGGGNAFGSDLSSFDSSDNSDTGYSSCFDSDTGCDFDSGFDSFSSFDDF